MQITKLKGLNVQENSFNDDIQGNLELAENILLSQDNIVTKRNGYSTFFSTPPSNTLNITDYKNKLILISSNTITRVDQVPGTGDYLSSTNLSGQTFTITLPRSVQAGGNLYIPTSSYMLKLEDTSSALLKAGVDKAPDLTYLPLGSGSVYSATVGIHKPDTQIGYRVVFGRKDVNKNLVLGAPSELTQNQNTLNLSSAVALATYNVTVTTSSSHGLNVNDFVTIRSSNGSVAVPDGEYTVTATPSGTQFTFSTSAVLSSVPTGVTSLSWGVRIQPKLEFTIPANVNTTNFIYRVYRTNPSINNNVDPDESTLQLVQEANVASADLANGYIQYTDTVDDLFKTAYLYTNPNTGDGITEANFPPPLGTDLAVFKNHLFIANPTTFYSYNLSLIRSSASTFVNGDYIDVIQQSNVTTCSSAIWQSGNTVRYVVGSTSNLFVGSYVDFTGFAASANNGKFIITAVGGGYVDCTTSRNNNTLDEVSVSGSAYPVRRYTAAAANSYNTAAGGNFLLTTSSPSVSINIDNTARSLCKAINRDSKSNIYASYTSSSQSLPGQMFFYGRTVAASFALQANTSTVGSNFNPVLPNTANDFSIAATNANYPNGLYISKQSEYEAFPLTSFILVGAQNGSIQRIIALKNSLIVIKDDGVYRVSGTSRSDFTAYPIDLTINCNAPESVIDLDGSVFLSTNEGVSRVTESSASLISRPIEPLLNAVYTNTSYSTSTYATVIPSDRLYLMTTLQPNGLPNTTYVYNYLTDRWTTSTILYKKGVVKASDNTHYAISPSNTIIKMRKNNTKLDYCDESATVLSTSSMSADKLSCTVTSTLALTVGDILVWNNAVNRIVSTNGSVMTFFQPVNFNAGDLPVHYKGITSSWTLSPLGLNEENLKQFSEMSINLRNSAVSYLDIGFVSDGSDTPFITWVSSAASIGWGLGAWGYFAWGSGETTSLTYSTYIAEPIRVFVPVQNQISTWLKPKFRHVQAGEPINMQAVNIQVRKISERISS